MHNNERIFNELYSIFEREIINSKIDIFSFLDACGLKQSWTSTTTGVCDLGNSQKTFIKDNKLFVKLDNQKIELKVYLWAQILSQDPNTIINKLRKLLINKT